MPRTLVAALLCALALTAAVAPPAGAKGPTVRAELQRMAAAGELDAATAQQYRDAYDGAQKTLKKLHGFRLRQLKAVVVNVNNAAARHQFTASRLKPEFLTLERNAAYWRNGALPRYGQRITFPGSQIVWQFYPGQGWQIQWLGTFGKANALWMVKTRDADLRALLDEILGLATQRAGGIAFEYLFTFDGGKPPWVSGLAQGTGLSALSRGAVRLKDTKYFTAARSALGIFTTPPPEGVLRNTAAGAHYLQYSYAPKLRIANGFTQALNGLYDFAALANDDAGRKLFAAGEAQLRAELPRYDTGAWSLYSIGQPPSLESDLGYHKVLRDFLRGLCDRLSGDAQPDPSPYCDMAERFTADLTTKPKVAITGEDEALRAKAKGAIRFTLDKVSTVTITATRRGKVVLSRSARLGHGRHAIAVKPSKAGPLQVAVRAVDLAGNAGADTATIHVRAAAK